MWLNCKLGSEGAGQGLEQVLSLQCRCEVMQGTCGMRSAIHAHSCSPAKWLCKLSSVKPRVVWSGLQAVWIGASLSLGLVAALGYAWCQGLMTGSLMSAGTLDKEISFKRGKSQKRKVFVIFTYILWQFRAEKLSGFCHYRIIWVGTPLPKGEKGWRVCCYFFQCFF